MVVNAPWAVHAEDPAFRYRLIDDELALTHGHQVSRIRDDRLCREIGIASVIVKPRGRGITPRPVVHDDRIQRRFTSSQVDRDGFTVITMHPTSEGNLPYSCSGPVRYCQNVTIS